MVCTEKEVALASALKLKVGELNERSHVVPKPDTSQSTRFLAITKNSFKMKFISPEEGVRHLDDELRAGAPEAEILISDGYFQRMFYPTEVDDSSSQESAAPPTAHPSSGRPLIDSVQSPSGNGHLVATVMLQRLSRNRSGSEEMESRVWNPAWMSANFCRHTGN